MSCSAVPPRQVIVVRRSCAKAPPELGLHLQAGRPDSGSPGLRHRKDGALLRLRSPVITRSAEIQQVGDGRGHGHANTKHDGRVVWLLAGSPKTKSTSWVASLLGVKSTDWSTDYRHFPIYCAQTFTKSPRPGEEVGVDLIFTCSPWPRAP